MVVDSDLNSAGVESIFAKWEELIGKMERGRSEGQEPAQEGSWAETCRFKGRQDPGKTTTIKKSPRKMSTKKHESD